MGDPRPRLEREMERGADTGRGRERGAGPGPGRERGAGPGSGRGVGDSDDQSSASSHVL